MTSDPTRAAPPRGTRPRNRRDLVVAAATDLFADRGYVNVAMSDVARAVNVQPSALYRYFASKQDLLVEVVARGTRLRQEAVRVGDEGGLGRMLVALADSGLASRSSTRLWAVEARNVDADALRGLRQQVRALPDALGRLLAAERADLTAAEADVLAWSTLDVLASISFHDERLPPRELCAELVGTMSRIVDSVPADEPPWPHPRRVEHPARRERLVAEAARLFAARGYGAVRLEDVAAAAGLSTAGSYTYVESKAHLLRLVVLRGATALAHEHVCAMAEVDDPSALLDELVWRYARFAWHHPDLLAVLLTETRQLDDVDAMSVRQTIADVDAVWVVAVTARQPDLGPTVARVRARAVQMIAQDVLGNPRLRHEVHVVPVVLGAMRAAAGTSQMTLGDPFSS